MKAVANAAMAASGRRFMRPPRSAATRPSWRAESVRRRLAMVMPSGDPRAAGRPASLGMRCGTQPKGRPPRGSSARRNVFDTVARSVYRHAGWLARVTRQRAHTSGHFPTRAVPTRAGAGGQTLRWTFDASVAELNTNSMTRSSADGARPFGARAAVISSKFADSKMERRPRIDGP